MLDEIIEKIKQTHGNQKRTTKMSKSTDSVNIFGVLDLPVFADTRTV